MIRGPLPRRCPAFGCSMHRDASGWLRDGNVQALRDHMDVFDTLMAPHGRWRKLCRCGLMAKIRRAVAGGPRLDVAGVRGRMEALAASTRPGAGLSDTERRIAMTTKFFGPELGWGTKVTPAHL
jgi:hypothetical protein